MKTSSSNRSTSASAGPEIEIVDLHKNYDMGEQTVHALRGLSLQIPSNRFCIVHGPSGSGKSTLLHLLGGLDRPTGGSVRVGDRNLNDLDDGERTQYRRKDVGFVFQTLNLLPNLTALENVLVPFIPEGPFYKMSDQARQILAELGLEDRIDHRPGRLSGGEQQRVAIARALLKKPSLILADEPTGELDTETGQTIFSLLRRIQRERNATVMVVTHDTEFIQPEDLTASIKDGQLVDE